MQVIREKKISGTRLREIAARAGISTGTLNYHFPSKELLLQSLLNEMDRIFNEERPVFLSEMGLDPTRKLKWFLDQERQLLSDRRELAEVFIDFWGHGLADEKIRTKIQHMYDRWRGDVEATLAEGIASGALKTAHKGLVSALVVSLMEGAALQYLIDSSAIDLQDYFTESLEMVVCYLQPHRHLEGSEVAIGREAYPSDLGDDAWRRVEPLVDGRGQAGRPRDVDMREVVNAISYVLTSGCSWRMLPHDFPKWQTVYRYYRMWREEGSWERIAAQLGLEAPNEIAGGAAD
jgi:AcrR family transcriptional regulator